MRMNQLLLPGALVILAVVGFAWGQALQPMDTAPNYNGAKIVTELTGDQEIGSVATRSVGKAYFDVRPDCTLHYKIEVTGRGIDGLTGIFVQQGRAGQVGPIVARIYVPAEPSGTMKGTIAEGTLTAANLSGPLAGGSVDDLVRLMMDNNAYVNISTAINPGGELRGNIPFPYH